MTKKKKYFPVITTIFRADEVGQGLNGEEKAFVRRSNLFLQIIAQFFIYKPRNEATLGLSP